MNQNEEEYVLQTSMMGDIREDVQFLGLGVTDLIWIMGLTLGFGGLSFVLPLPVMYKLLWVIIVMGTSTASRILRWPFRRKRWIRYVKQPREGTGDKMETLLGVSPDGWLYRSGKTLHIVASVNAPPWETAVFSHKKLRILGYESFLRSCVREGFEAAVSAEQVNDFRHEIWNAKRQKVAASQGIQELNQERIELWEHLARTGEAQRSEYTIRLSINEVQITLRERDDEPKDLTSDQLKRYRMMAEIREKIGRVFSGLEQGGHTWSILSGFSIPEITGRWWDRTVWEEWKANEGNWDDDLMETNDTTTILVTESKGEDDSNAEAKESTDWAQELDKLGLNNLVDNRLESANDLEQDEDALIQGLMAIGATSETHQNEKDESEPKKQKSGFKINVLKRFKTVVRASVGRFKPFLIGMGKIRGVLDRTAKKSKQTTTSEYKKEESNLDAPIEKAPSKSKSKLEGVYIFTSPTATGKSFLAANVAVAAETTITLIDLSPDRGSISVINPMLQSDHREGWEHWGSRHAPELSLWTPVAYPQIDEVDQIIQEGIKKGPVILDLPWSYPDRTSLLRSYKMVAVVDSDYHHWIQWEKENLYYDCEVWLNKVDPDMQQRMEQLIQEKFNKAPAAVFPFFLDAPKWIFQGRPLAIHPQARSFFLFSEADTGEESA